MIHSIHRFGDFYSFMIVDLVGWSTTNSSAMVYCWELLVAQLVVLEKHWWVGGWYDNSIKCRPAHPITETGAKISTFQTDLLTHRKISYLCHTDQLLQIDWFSISIMDVKSKRLPKEEYGFKVGTVFLKWLAILFKIISTSVHWFSIVPSKFLLKF